MSVFSYPSRDLIANLKLLHVWIDGVACLEDGCTQVPGTTCYQDNVLFILMLQGSAATALSPSDLSIIQQAYKCAASGLPV